MEVKLGKYKHFKGFLYEVIGVANHSETLEQMVVYKQLEAHGDFPLGTIWVRPLPMFMGEAEQGGKSVPRFEYQGLTSTQ